MKIELSWENIAGNRVLYYKFQASWHWDDFFEIKKKADKLLETEPSAVPLVFDLRSAPNMPPGMIVQSRKVAESRHPNGSPVILLGANRLVQAAFDIVKRMLGENTEKFTNDVLIIRSMEEAIEYLKNRQRPN